MIMGTDNKPPFLQNELVDPNLDADSAAPERRHGGGPKTRAGKARASANARTHCITSNDPVIPHIESQEEWDSHLQGFIEYFAPVGAVEAFLVERYANLLWRTRRITRHEISSIMQRMIAIPEDMLIAANYLTPRASEGVILPDEDEVFARQHNTVLPSTIRTITRYEAHLQRQMLQTLRQLLALQARRRGDPPYASPVDVKGLPAG